MGRLPSNVLGTWELTVCHKGQTFYPVLDLRAVDGELKATYRTFDGSEIEARSLMVDGELLRFRVEGTFEGLPLEMSFNGVVNQNWISGTAAYRHGAEAGVLAFDGQKRIAR